MLGRLWMAAFSMAASGWSSSTVIFGCGRSLADTQPQNLRDEEVSRQARVDKILKCSPKSRPHALGTFDGPHLVTLKNPMQFSDSFFARRVDLTGRDLQRYLGEALSAGGDYGPLPLPRRKALNRVSSLDAQRTLCETRILRHRVTRLR